MDAMLSVAPHNVAQASGRFSPAEFELYERLVVGFFRTNFAGVPTANFSSADAQRLYTMDVCQRHSAPRTEVILPNRKAIQEFPQARARRLGVKFPLVHGMSDQQIRSVAVLANNRSLQIVLDRYFSPSPTGWFGLLPVTPVTVKDFTPDCFPGITNNPRARMENLGLSFRPHDAEGYYPSAHAVAARYLIGGPRARFDSGLACRLQAVEQLPAFMATLRTALPSFDEQQTARRLLLRALKDRETQINGPDDVEGLKRWCIKEAARTVVLPSLNLRCSNNGTAVASARGFTWPARASTARKTGAIF